MATFRPGIRRGLPRTPAGEPWPPADSAAVGVADAPATGSETEAGAAIPSTGSGAEAGAASPVAELVEASSQVTVDPSTSSGTEAGAVAPSTGSGPEAGVALRRGLPRVAGGEPWPPTTGGGWSALPAPTPAAPEANIPPEPEASVIAAAAAASPSTTPADGRGAEVRRGLPRTPGGEPWPPGGTVGAVEAAAAPAPAAPATDPDAAALAPASPPAAKAPAPTGPRAPLPFTRTVWAGPAAAYRSEPKPEPKRYGPFTKGQWAGAVILGGGGLLVAAAMAVLFVRAFLSLGFMQDFLATYPGEYHLPEGAPVGIPAWLGWQHFFNAFLMVLIIRTGLTIRSEKRPTVFWAPKRNPKGKTSLTIWFHQSLDLLWVVNGVAFVVLLFATGQWMRIVPTSWEVFPHALSAALQYVSLDWPTENGWVNYNALQQLAYFSTVFLAAPLAIASGFRMSGLWPKGNKKLSAAYPIEWARTVHFPVMLFFVVFIIIHVFLVLATGALRNLGHMYAAQGSVDPTAYADNWTGFWLFVASLVVIAVAWIAARPMTLAPIARLFGTVSGR